MNREEVVGKISSLNGKNAHAWVIDAYNSIDPLPRGYVLQEKDPWCAATVSAVLHDLGYDDISECSCPIMVKKAKDLGIWVENDAYVPKPGDVIMYDWQDDNSGDNMGNPDHVGIVIKVTDKKITVREGNKGGSVGNRSIDINGKFIRGFVIPPYEADADELKPEVNISSSNKPKAEEKPQTSSQRYIVGRTYHVNVRTALNVRKGPGKGSSLVGYANLTPDGKKHAFPNGA